MPYICLHLHACSVTQSCDPMDYSLPGPLSIEFSRQEQVGVGAISSSRGPSQPRDQTHIFCLSHIGRWTLYHGATWESLSIYMKRVDRYIEKQTK